MKSIISVIFIFIVSSSIVSEVWEESIPNLIEQDYREFEKRGYTSRTLTGYNHNLELLPAGMDFEKSFKTQLKEYNPELSVEMLFVLDRPDVDNLMLYLLNNFRAFSEQEGLEYYSFNREKMAPLIDKCYFVNDKKKRIEDPVVTSLPKYEIHQYFQKDSTFSSNYYNLVTQTTENNIWIQMENIDSLRVMGLVKALDEGDQRVNILLTAVEDKVLIYSLAQIKNEPKIKQVLKWKVNVPGSFKRRMSTIVEWYRERL